MKDEIKEILDDLLFTTTLPNASVKLNKEKLKLLKDYITNLQEKIAQIYNYITQENEELSVDCYYRFKDLEEFDIIKSIIKGEKNEREK